MGSLFTVLSIIWAFNSEKISTAIIFQMVIAIPLILFASLSYAKLGYERNHTIWDRFGWFTNNIGYLLFLNATGLMVVAFSSRFVGIIYFWFVIFLAVLYYVFNIISQKGSFKEHFWKLVLWVALVVVGGLLQIR
jgi:hypothetical protein